MARTPASRKIGRVLTLLALFWAGQQAVQTVRTAVGVRAVPFARPPAGAWARKPLIARGAASKADGQPDEVDDNEDDEVSKLAKEHDEVQSYDANQVICWVVDPVGITDGEEITQLQGQKYAGSFLLEKSSAADFEAKLKLSDGPKEMLIARIKKLKAAAAIRDAKRKLDHAGASEDRIAIVGDMLSALVKMDAETTLLKAAIAVIKEQLTKLKDNQDRITMVGDMLKTLVELKANDLLKADARPLVVLRGALSVSTLLQQDMKGVTQHADRLQEEVKSLVTAQKRRFAGFRVALSLFVLRASPVFLGEMNGTATSLVRWLSQALAANKDSDSAALELEAVIGSRKDLYSYEGSVPRPPCTPNVRWFVLGDPQPSDIEQLSFLLKETQLAGRVHGNARQVQPFGPSRRLHVVQTDWEVFEAPVIKTAESMSPGRQKMILIERYCKVFVLCSVFLICTPLFFRIYNSCADADEEDTTWDASPLVHQRSPSSTDADGRRVEMVGAEFSKG